MKALKGDDFRYSIRIFSSVDRRTKKTREIGSDAIRVTLYDLKKDRPVKAERRVNRTVNAFSNMKERARELWKYVADGEHICPKCESLLVKRTAKRSKKDFMGCSSYPGCTHTQNIQAISVNGLAREAPTLQVWVRILDGLPTLTKEQYAKSKKENRWKFIKSCS